MKVHVLRLVMGKATNYDQNGKLKNSTITAKYGEMELENILKTWRELGACEISCVKAYNHPDLTNIPELVDSVNKRINTDVQQGIKPKTEIELLKEQNDLMKEQIAALSEKVNNPIIPVQANQFSGFNKTFEDETITVNNEAPTTEKEIRESLFVEAKELGLTPAKNVRTEILKDLVAKAKQ